MVQRSMKYWQKFDVLDGDSSVFFIKKNQSVIAIGGSMLLVAVVCMLLLDFDFINVIMNTPRAYNRFVSLYLPPSFLEVDKLIEAIWVTIVISVSAGTIGSILAFAAALGMSKQTGKIKVLKHVLRALATLIRNVPATIWAIILLMTFWYGEFLALLVMTLGTFGFNARLYSDMIDETNTSSIEALKASGANYWQVIAQSVIPETFPTTVSWTLYAIELNIRAATIIGMLAGGGIGHLIGIYKHFRRFDQLMGAVILVVVLIIVFDQLSMYIRKRIL